MDLKEFREYVEAQRKASTLEALAKLTNTKENK